MFVFSFFFIFDKRFKIFRGGWNNEFRIWWGMVVLNGSRVLDSRLDR